MREKAPERQERAKTIIRKLKRYYPDAKCALNHSNSLELLVATILSAQCTDERVNRVTPALFEHFPTAQDYAKAPVEKIEDEIRTVNFYRKLGFELGGTEISLSIPQNFKCTEVPGLRFVNSNKVDPEAILRLYSQHSAGSVRTADEIRRLLQIPNMRVYTAWDEQNKLQAYAIEGKGADLEGYIHEWGGGVSKLLPLLKFATQEQKKPLTIITPPHSQNLIRQLKEAGAVEHSGVLGMIKILNAPALLTKIKKYIRSTGVEDVVLEAREGRFYMGYREEIFSTDSESDLVRLLFGPLKAGELNAFDKNTAEVFERLFPLSLWIWGWDSV
jgi:hypothetical protein